MKNENMGVEELYLAPNETIESDLIVSSDISEDKTSEAVSVAESKRKSRKAKRMEELPEQRGTHSKVFRMNDGTEQAIFSPSAIHVFDDETQTFEDVEPALTEEEDGKHYISGKNHFVAKFSCEEDNDELFSIEKGMHKVTVYARKNKKNRNKGSKPILRKNAKDSLKMADILAFADIEPDTDYEYAVEGDGVKENIIVKKPAAIYRYPFALKCENVTARFDEEAKRVAFISNESGDEVFFIPAPFMTDAADRTSTAVNFETKTDDNGLVHLTVIADADWLNASDRTFPVAIDPQIKLSGSSAMTTYSWENCNLYNASLHMVGTTGTSDGVCNAKRMYIQFNMPTLPRNPRIKKAELVFTQKAISVSGEKNPKFGLYRVSNEIVCGNVTPGDDDKLIDFAQMKENNADGTLATYAFDITSLVDEVNKGESGKRNLVMKMLDEADTNRNSVTLYGSADSSYAPTFVITYESSYGVNSSYRTHTHELGRFGQGSVDLQCGNLMFESEDFAWSGNRMPVTIKHLYNSALSDYQYTADSAIRLNTANFSAMQLGLGFKLNLMQSMMPASFRHEGEAHTGYVYVGENGDETYFKKNGTPVCCDSNSQCYHLYEDVNGSGMVYDPDKRAMTQGEDVYLFDASGRLIRITDAFKNHMDITYTAGKISSVTDGAGREFRFDYSGDSLTTITAPDNTTVLFTYSGNLLSMITYPNGKKVSISYTSNKPMAVTLLDASDNTTYKVEYEFTGDRLCNIIERGADNSVGATTSYSFSAAASTTTVATVEPRDELENETFDNTITTVYTFDDDGNIVSEYVYSTLTDKAGSSSETNGINPHAGDGGAGVVSNINNLLTDHNFENLNSWWELPSNCGEFVVRNNENEGQAKFGRKYLFLQSLTDCGENGVYQVTNWLPAGQYTFSAYLRVISGFTGCDNPGAFIRVTDTNGNLLGVSEHLADHDISYTRLIVPFELDLGQSVQVQILTSGRGVVHVDGAQLENNPYANAYNMLDNGNFERGLDGWTFEEGTAYYSTDEHFNMSKSLLLKGDIDSPRKLYQIPSVCTSRSTRETFTLSGWAKGYGLPKRDQEDRVDEANTPKFELRAEIIYTDNSIQPEPAVFSPCTEDWQFASVQFAKNEYKTIRAIRIYCDYSYNSGNAYFDDIQLVRNSLEKGLTSNDFSGSDTGDDSVEETASTDETIDTTPTFEEAKDAFGNALTETTFTDGEFGTIYRAFKFNADDADMMGDDSGNNLIEETDARGNKTTYTVDGDTSRNEEVIDRLGNKTVYEYDTSGRTTKVTNKLYAEETEALKNPTVSYSYDTFDNMTEIVRGDGMKYVLAYNAFHNLESIGIDKKNEPLIQYTYKNGNGRLKEMTYANGHKMKAVYNSIGQMVAEKWFDKEGVETAHYKYVYDGEGNIVRSIDIFACKEYNYEYEEGRIVRATELDITLSGELVTGKTLVNSVKYYYDADGNLTRKRIEPFGGSVQTIYYETNDDNTTVKFYAGGRYVTSHSKSDSFGRKVFDELQLGTDCVSRQFVCHEGKVTDTHKTNTKVKSSATTQLVSQILLSDGHVLTYEYDAEERITSVSDRYFVEKKEITDTVNYTYDALGQLLTETRAVQTVDYSTEDPVGASTTERINSMEYDNYGNITKKNGVEYIYGKYYPDDDFTKEPTILPWKDLLTYYNGVRIDYDEQGNPTSYLGHTLTWEKGRQLKKFDNIEYTYNANGIRTSKNVNGVLHTYTLDGAKILRETWGGNTLVPLYDNEDSVCGILYNGTPYYFIKNLQGDVIAIVNKDAEPVARYSYDAWGKVLATTDANGVDVPSDATHIANINPFRYRGYYYDREIGLYYLQSRYYDASVGRFVNGDVLDSLQEVCAVLESNLFTYCQNDPSNESDYAGNLVASIIKSILLGVFKGFIGRLGSDCISYLYRVLFVDKDTKFVMSSLSKYLEDIVADVATELFSILKKGKCVAQFAVVVAPFFVKIVKGTMETEDWVKLCLAVASFVLKNILLKKIDQKKKNELKALKKYYKSKKRKKRKNKNPELIKGRYRVYLKYKKKGFNVNITFDITDYVLDNIFEILALL